MHTLFSELKDLRVAGLQPNAISFSAAILACSESQQWLSALRLLTEAWLCTSMDREMGLCS